MSATVLVAACGVAVAAAVRSTWSPCGLSMLTSITPFGERARGHRYGVTAVWFVAGAVVGGAVLGAVTGLLAALVGLLGLPGRALLAAAVVAAAVGVAADLHVPGVRLPTHPRQVDETWLRRYRRWVYASGFGVQIGSGLATYIMTAGVWVTAALAVLTAYPASALLVCLLFAGVRGLAVLLAARVSDTDRLRVLLRRLETAAPASVALAVAAQTAVVIAGAADLAGLPGALVALTAAAPLAGAAVAVAVSGRPELVPTPTAPAAPVSAPTT